jgi:hypothetical protein
LKDRHDNERTKNEERTKKKEVVNSKHRRECLFHEVQTP